MRKPWLGNTAMSSCIGLFPIVSIDDNCDLLNQFGPCLKIGGLFWCVGNRIPYAVKSFCFDH